MKAEEVWSNVALRGWLLGGSCVMRRELKVKMVLEGRREGTRKGEGCDICLDGEGRKDPWYARAFDEGSRAENQRRRGPVAHGGILG